MSTVSFDLQKDLVGHWTMDNRDISGGVLADQSAHGNDGSINEPTSNYFGDVGAWRGDVDELGAADGFKNVGVADATANTGFEDIFTGQFRTGDFSNSGTGYYVYLAFAAKWNEIPVWGQQGTWLQKPTPDPDKYQLYILQSDGQNSRDEYFRLYYGDTNDTAVGRLADPFVWTQEDEASSARIIGSTSSRTVEPYTDSPIGDGMRFKYSDSKDIAVPGAPSYGTGSFSISFWMRGDFTDVSTKYPNVTNNFWGRGNSDSGFRFDSDSTGRYVQGFVYQNSYTNYAHICAVVDQEKGEADFYENGNLIYTDSFTAGETISDSIGQIGSGGGDYAPVDISDFRYYKRTLSAAEVNALYQMRAERRSAV